MIRRRRKFNITLPSDKKYQLESIEIVADGGIAATSVALGVLIPVLILNTENRPDIENVIEAHASAPTVLGDVVAVWLRRHGGAIPRDYMITLLLHFLRPIESYAVLDFSKERAGVIDQMLKVGYVYLQPGRRPDRLGQTFESSNRVLIEVKDTGFEADWERMLMKHLLAEFKLRGLDRQMSREAARKTIANGRRLGGLRMPYRPAEEQSVADGPSES